MNIVIRFRGKRKDSKVEPRIIKTLNYEFFYSKTA